MIIIDHFTGWIRDGSLSASHEGWGSDFSLGRDLMRTAPLISDGTQYHHCRDQSLMWRYVFGLTRHILHMQVSESLQTCA